MNDIILESKVKVLKALVRAGNVIPATLLLDEIIKYVGVKNGKK